MTSLAALIHDLTLLHLSGCVAELVWNGTVLRVVVILPNDSVPDAALTDRTQLLDRLGFIPVSQPA